jgi:hypothetical protein
MDPFQRICRDRVRNLPAAIAHGPDHPVIARVRPETIALHGLRHELAFAAQSTSTPMEKTGPTLHTDPRRRASAAYLDEPTLSNQPTSGTSGLERLSVAGSSAWTSSTSDSCERS